MSSNPQSHPLLQKRMEPRVIHGTSMKEYAAVHHWLKKNYGKASKCESPECPKKSLRYNWALKIGLQYERKRENFLELCRSCHSKMDFTEETRQKMSFYGKKPRTVKQKKSFKEASFKRLLAGKKANKLNREQVHNIRKLIAEGARTVDIAKQFSVTVRAIDLIKSNRSWKNL